MWAGAPLTIASAIIALTVAGCGKDSSDETASGARTTTSQQGVEQLVRADHAKSDADRDGSVDRREAEATIRRDFKDSDLNRDGVLTIADVQEDVKRGRGGKVTGSISDHLPYDTNGDGKITEREYLAEHMKGIFRRADADSSGDVSADEGVRYHLRTSRPKERK